MQRSLQSVFDSISNCLHGGIIEHHCLGDILLLEYMLFGSIQSSSDEELYFFKKSKDVFICSKATSLPEGSLSFCSLVQPLVICRYQRLIYTLKRLIDQVFITVIKN